MLTEPIIELEKCTNTTGPQITIVSLASDNTDNVRNQQIATVSLGTDMSIVPPTITNDEPPVVSNGEDVVMINTDQLLDSKSSDEVVSHQIDQNMNEDVVISANSTNKVYLDDDENLVDYSDAPLSDEDKADMGTQVATHGTMFYPHHTIIQMSSNSAKNNWCRYYFNDNRKKVLEGPK